MKGKKGLSTVVTTLIILVVSVLLATVVTYYAINMTTTRVQEENLRISKAHIWANSSFAQAAFVIVNIGGRDTLIDKIHVRGQEIPWGSVHCNRTSTAPTTDLDIVDTTSTYWNGTGTPGVGEVATADLSLRSGDCLIIYIDSPGTISVEDTGVTCSITVFTASAQYKVEVNVESAS
ncbi:MAG: hypothetical protein ACUVRA_02685 [Candidatus Bathyarchaeaceae archaeon]